jgi:glycosyltransferase involved in cell wall biosynthesis
MRICYVCAWNDPSAQDPRAVIERTVTLREFARGQVALGHEVQVVHLFHCDETLEEAGVRYQFVRPTRGFGLLGRCAAWVRRDRQVSYYQSGRRMLRWIERARPDVIHFFGLTLDLNLAIVARFASARGIPLVVQYHGGGPGRTRLRQTLQRYNLRLADRLLFTTLAHAESWVAFAPDACARKVVDLMETSSTFRRRPREEARRVTGMRGDPVLLWVGRLHAIKDPLTALRGFEQVLTCWPDAHLYLHYLTDEMLPDLRAFVASRPCLSGHVHFRGRAPHEQMEAIYNSADVLLQASLREFSGFAVLEAMACGVIPVVTDIPSFRAMTCDGRFGVLFPVEDSDALAAAMLSIDRASIPVCSAAIRLHFERNLSFPALAQRLEAVYREVVCHAG